MDFSTVIGLVLGILSLVVGFTLEGGHLGSLVQITAALIVIGGTIGAVIVSFPVKKLKKVPFIIKYAFVEQKHDAGQTIDKLLELSNVSRRKGLLALETQDEIYGDDPFLKEGVQLVVDGVEGEMIQDILNREIDHYEKNILSIGKVFEAAGGYAPTMGIIGTVMGLVHVLGSLENPGTLGPAIAVAFIATLYGVASANVIYLPIYNKIKMRLEDDIMVREMKAEGLMSIQHGENTTVLQNKLLAYVDIDKKREMQAEQSMEYNAASVTSDA